MISDNYLSQFYEFLDPTASGRIWNGDDREKRFLFVRLT
jgi:hypothetical protein